MSSGGLLETKLEALSYMFSELQFTNSRKKKNKTKKRLHKAFKSPKKTKMLLRRMEELHLRLDQLFNTIHQS